MSIFLTIEFLILAICFQAGAKYQKRKSLFGRGKSFLEDLFFEQFCKEKEYILHDIATPLSIILECVRCLEDGDKNLDYLFLIKQSSKNIERILRGSDEVFLRDIIEDIDVKVELYKVLNIFKRKLEDNGIDVIFDVKTVRLKGSSVLFYRVILNLFRNAVEELETSRKNKKFINISCRCERGFLVLRIKDNGKGICLFQRKKIFQEGKTYKDCFHKGVGLFFIKNIVEDVFKGKILVRSRKGVFTEFCIKVPMVC